ncbi:MAG: hypothetical protein IJX18_04345 [Clostridia bacterium]|nr:hypothetical protein [Clostridia bacterium]
MLKSAKEIAYIAVFCALLIGGQLLFSAVPGIEIVTLLLVCFSFTFGALRGCVCAVAFSLLRQLVFGFFPTVLVLYLIYFTALCACFGALGSVWKGKEKSRLGWLVLIVCAGAVCFNLLDVLITSLWYGYAPKAAQAYFIASWSFTLPQVACNAVTVGLCFLPLTKALGAAKRKLQ